MIRYSILILSVMMFTSGTPGERKQKPTIWLIGDSTVKNGSGKGQGGLWGWGDFLYQKFDTSKVSVKNFAIGGRSSRTFITEGRWYQILERLKPGDYAKWAEESAMKEKAYYIDLNELIAEKYEALGEAEVKTKLFGTDSTHTLEAGAILNAGIVAEGIKSLNGCKLKKFLRH